MPNHVINRALFSDYYLDFVVPGFFDQKDSLELEFTFNEIRRLYKKIKLIKSNLLEAQTEGNFIRPVLELLGHHFAVQPTLRTSQGVKRPDYVFFPNSDAFEFSQSRINTRSFFKTAVAIGDAKAWSRDLDRKYKSGSDAFTNMNPSFQIDFYLRETDRVWGILTNGRQWRLFHRNTSYRLDQFYQFNLEDILESDKFDLDSFCYFYYFFRCEAFVFDHEGKSFLDQVYSESKEHTVGVSEDLEIRVYKALKILMQGFLDFSRNQLEASPELIQQVHENSLILLYRILFVLHSESRNLLPIDNPHYANDHSLSKLAADAHQRIEEQRYILPTMNDYWSRLRGLFQLVNDGWEEFIPQYNGGLFSPKRYPFLETYEIGNQALARALDLVTYTKDGERIAYRDLDARHLWNVYQSLLDLKPFFEGSNIDFIRPKAKKRSVRNGQTPDYISRYIVEQTLAPLCKGKNVEEILQLKVLDPAVGSGYFLIEVVDFLAEEIVRRVDTPLPSEIDSEISYWRRRVVESCVYGVSLDPTAVELAKLSLWLHTVAKNEPLSFLDHHIRCGNSLLGAEIADLANPPVVEDKRRKVKLSNALQVELNLSFDFTDTAACAIQNYLEIEETENSQAIHIDLKEQRLDSAEVMLHPYKEVANLWLSCYFGNEVERSDYHSVLDMLQTNELGTIKSIPCFAAAQEIAEKSCFFHWEIEFPEVFRDRSGRLKRNRGFSAVVGNPPCLRHEEIGEEKKYLATYKTYNGVADLYVYFMERSHCLLKDGGRFGIVTSNKFIRSKYGRNLRKYLETDVQICQIIDFGDLPVFENTALMASILLTENVPSRDSCSPQYAEIGNLEFDSFETEVNRVSRSLDRNALQDGNWIASRVNDIDFDIQARTLPLGDYCQAKIRRGVMTGLNQAFVVNAETRKNLIAQDENSVDILKPLVAGNNIREYHVEFEDCFLIWAVNGVDIQRYPAVFEHLKCFKDSLESRRDKGGHWWEIRSCRYAVEFEMSKILFPDLGANCRFCLDKSGLFLINNAYFIAEDDYYLLALLNSQFAWDYLKRICTRFRGKTLRFSKQYLEKVPIRVIDFTTPVKERRLFHEKAKLLYEKCLEKDDVSCLLGFVDHHISKQQVDIVYDLLSFLAEKMSTDNLALYQEKSGFLKWLEREISFSVDDLKNKRIIENYQHANLSEVISILKKNQKVIPIEVSSRNFQESVETEFSISCERLRPRSRQVVKTNQLIDAIVFKLYGMKSGQHEEVKTE